MNGFETYVCALPWTGTQVFERLLEASEKLWGATAEMLKTVAAKRGHGSQDSRGPWRFVADLCAELKDRVKWALHLGKLPAPKLP